MEVELGVTVRVKSGAVTLIVTLTLCDCPSVAVAVPVIVSVALPPGVFVDVVTVIVEVPDPVMEVGKKEADAPDGRPAAAKVTCPVKPYSTPTVRV
jgi:hypothetical protein